MKINWGTGIVITLVFFAGLMSFMVYSAMQQRFDLVSENYYEEELQYQEIINKKKNALLLNEKAQLVLNSSGIILNLPSELLGKTKNVNAHMYYELNAGKDFTWNQENTLDHQFEIPFENYHNGKWIAKVTVECEGVEYYFEPEIIL